MSGPISAQSRAQSAGTLIRFHDGLRPRPRGLDLAALRKFVKRLNTEYWLCGRSFDVTLVDDAAIAALNLRFRGKHGPTDVLSFPFEDSAAPPALTPGFKGFAGDIVISLEAAKRNAAVERHPLGTELRQLILHGALHLAGYDHETDQGEMNELELNLRQSLGIEGGRE